MSCINIDTLLAISTEQTLSIFCRSVFLEMEW